MSGECPVRRYSRGMPLAHSRLSALGLLMIVAVALAGCTINIGTPTGEVEQPAATREPVEEPATPTATADPDAPDEAAYLEFMKQQAPLLYAENPERDVLALGYTVCTSFRDGASGRDVVLALGQGTQDLGLNTEDALVAAWAAAHELCPEYSDKLDDLEN